ncbi:hypothetical protein D6745_03235 [Candidatus Woesearchaeota archaeon]|nr:MAG: hypothetical protein D6745_03235 [Candidatus Woesearchaeota archaeon]
MIRKSAIILLMLTLLAFFIAGCAKKPLAEQQPVQAQEGAGASAAQNIQSQQAAESQQQIEDENVSEQISEVDSMDNELDDTDLDNLENDLASIDW